jgi:hypothetical protein
MKRLISFIGGAGGAHNAGKINENPVGVYIGTCSITFNFCGWF